MNCVRASRINLELSLRQKLDGLQTSCLDRNNLVVVSMQNEYRNVDAPEIRGEISL